MKAYEDIEEREIKRFKAEYKPLTCPICDMPLTPVIRPKSTKWHCSAILCFYNHVEVDED